MNQGKGERSPGVEATGEEILRRTSHLGSFSTGSTRIDGLLQGGLRQGRLVEFFGRSSSGKTQLAMQAALVGANTGADPLYIDTEGGFRPERMEEIAEARGWKARDLLGRVVYVRCDSSAAQMEMIRDMESRQATKGCRLVVIDTLTRNFTIDMPGASNLQSRQAALDVHLSEMARDAYVSSRAYLLTNRVTFGTLHDVRIGGQTVEQLVQTSIRLEKAGAEVNAKLMSTGESVTVSLGKDGVT